MWPFLKSDLKEEVKEAAHEGTKEALVSFRDEIVDAIKEGIREGMGELSDKINSLGNEINSLGKTLGSKIDKIPDRIVEELYGNQTVRWGHLILDMEIEDRGYKIARISVKELKFINRITKGGDENKIDEVLIYERGGKRTTFLIEGKHKMGVDEVQKAITQMDIAVKTAEEFKGGGANLGELVPVFIFYTKSGTKPTGEYLKEIGEWAAGYNLRAIVILPEGELRWVPSEEEGKAKEDKTKEETKEGDTSDREDNPDKQDTSGT